MTRAAIAGLVVPLLAVAAPATTHAREPAMQTRLAAAAAYWHQPADNVRVAWDAGAVCDNGPLATACTDVNSRVVHLNPEQWRLISSPQRCAIIVHEVGHLIVGPEHTDSGVMARVAAIPAICWRYARPPKKGIVRLSRT